MLQTLIKGESLGGVVLQHLLNQVEQLLVVFVIRGHVTLREKNTASEQLDTRGQSFFSHTLETFKTSN